MQTFSTEELLLAAAVRQRVEEMRVTKGKTMSKEEYSAYLEKPVDHLIGDAVRELQGIAMSIRRATLAIASDTPQ